MDKTDILWYNTDMNGILEIITIRQGETRVTKGYEVFVPDGKSAVNGECVSETGVAIIPPRTEYGVQTGGVCALLDRAVLPFKSVKIIENDVQGGIRCAVFKAKEYLNTPLNGVESVLNALGNLVCAVACALCADENYSPAVALVKREIESNVSNAGYALDGYLKNLPLNGDYVRKLFKKEIGVTPHEYLTAKRMELAQKLLTSGVSNTYSNYSVGQISEICGFSEPLYFSRVFKNYFGVSPSDYAKRLKMS